MIGTAILCLVVAVVTDDRNRIPTFVRPYCYGACITVIGLGFGMNAGYAINPARDLGPRIFTSIVGYGWEVFRLNI
jgi:glycerol uptake facilitator-like aquaporin